MIFIWPLPFESSRPGKGGKENTTSYARFVVGNVVTVSLKISRSETKILPTIVAERNYDKERDTHAELQKALRGKPKVHEVICLM